MSIKQGEYLKKLRTENNLSQEKLGEKLGLSRQSISKWEQGNAVPDIENIMKLAKLYNVSVDSIVNGEEEKKEEISKEKKIPEIDINLASESTKQKEKAYAEKGRKQEKKKVHHTWVFYSYPVLMVILYAVLGVLFSPKGWYMGWIVFLTIPLFYTGVLAYNKKKPVIFCYPVLMLIIYLLGGFFLKLWHPLWIIFLTIPIFYIITARKKK